MQIAMPIFGDRAAPRDDWAAPFCVGRVGGQEVSERRGLEERARRLQDRLAAVQVKHGMEAAHGG